jgi:hypothetical protein
MRIKQDRSVIFRTVPRHFVQSQKPAGSYSHTIGRFAVLLSAQSVSRFNRPLLQPGLDGIPNPSKSDACRFVLDSVGITEFLLVCTGWLSSLCLPKACFCIGNADPRGEAIIKMTAVNIISVGLIELRFLCDCRGIGRLLSFVGTFLFKHGMVKKRLLGAFCMEGNCWIFLIEA